MEIYNNSEVPNEIKKIISPEALKFVKFIIVSDIDEFYSFNDKLFKKYSKLFNTKFDKSKLSFSIKNKVVMLID